MIDPAEQRQTAISILADLSALIAIYSSTQAHQPGAAEFVRQAKKRQAKLANWLLHNTCKNPSQPIS